MKQTPLTNELYDYLFKISIREHPVLKEIREETSKLPLAVMQTPPEQVQFFQLLLKLINAKKVLELGTFTGYSALAMALALPPEGRLITCDINTEWTDRATEFFIKAKQDEKIELRIGKALKTMQDLLDQGYQNQFDFIFIDADKTNYLAYYEQALELISFNGLIAIDNIFWDAKVIDAGDRSAQTREIRRLNNHIRQDNRVDISLLSIADGLFLIKRRLSVTGG